MTTIREQLEESQKVCDAATEGPWSELDAQIRHTQIDGYIYPEARKKAQRQTAADIEFIRHARAALPVRNAQLEAVLALHEELVVYQLEDLETLEFMTDENGAQIVLTRVCRECSSEEVVDSIEECEYQDGIYGEEIYPCPTIRAIEDAAP